MNNTRSLFPILVIGLVAISFGSIFVKLCDVPSLVIASYRLGIASLFYWMVTRIRIGRTWFSLDRSQRKIALISGFFLMIHFTTWITSLKYTSVASSVVLVQSAPIFVAIGSALFLRERPAPVAITGILITIIGSIIISAHDFNLNRSSLTGNLLAVCGAIGAAGYILAGRKLRASVDTLRYVTAVYSICALLLLILTIVSGNSLVGYGKADYLFLIGIAVLPQIVGHTVFNWALEYLPATTVSVILLGEPFGASILAFFILGERLTLMKVIGGLIILAGVTVVLLAESDENVNST